MSAQITWTEFPNVYASTMSQHTGTWPDLVERLRTVGTFPSKTACPLFKMATFSGARKDENMIEVFGIEGDFDCKRGDPVSLERAKELLEQFGVRAVVYPSASWTLEKPRWRVVAPLATPCKPSERARFVARLNGVLGGILEPESFTASQAYYFGATPTNDYRVEATFDDVDEGNFIGEMPELDEIAIGNASASSAQQQGAPGATTAGDQSGADPRLVRELRSALAYLDFDDRAEWVAVAHALHGLGEVGHDLWGQWSELSKTKYDPVDAERVWYSCKTDRTGHAAIFVKAQRAGWVNPRSNAAHAMRQEAAPRGYTAYCDPDTGEVSYWDPDGNPWQQPEPADPNAHPLAQFVEIDGNVKPPRWIVPGFIDHGVVVIAGESGIGKTSALLPLALTVAGLHGGELLPRHWRHVVYVTEDVAQAKRILAGVTQHSGLGINLDDVRERFHLVEAVRLSPDHVVKVGKLYRDQFARDIDGVTLEPLVVMDTKSAVFELEDENSNSEVSRMMAALKQGFEKLPVWLIGHVAKSNFGRSDALSDRGASSSGADANGTAFLICEKENRYLILGKKRFEPKWRELEITSHTTEAPALDEFGNVEMLALRWGIAAPAVQSRKEAAEQATKQQRMADEATLRTDICEAVEVAWMAGNPLNRTGVKSKIGGKTERTGAAIENLVNERWLHEVTIPNKQRANNSKGTFLVFLSAAERDAVLAGEPLPEVKLAIPPSWQKQPIPVVPEQVGEAVEVAP